MGGYRADGRRQVAAATPWAARLAYSRAVAVGGQVFVAGTLPVDRDGRLVGGEDAEAQARQVLAVMAGALAEAGAGLADVVRLRIYLRDYEDLEAVARAQFAAFGQVRPACTVLRADLVRPEFRVQMDADAVIDGAARNMEGTR